MLSQQFVLGIAAALVVDLFAGGGGASTGIEKAIGRHVDIAVNHDRKALAMHQANHPQTLHLQTNVWDVDPVRVADGRPVGLLWASPDCRHFSPAKGGVPVSDRVRSLAWVVVKWATHVRPRVIFLENIPEFKNWGPIVAGRPCAARRGKTFRRWRQALERLGYRVEFRELVAADYDTPTTRKRLFMVARCDDEPIVWPTPTNGPGLKPYRTAAECIDWSIPCPSIFERPRPLAAATMRRIAHGVMRYVVNSPKPFIVGLAHGDHAERPGGRTHPADEQPLRTIHAGGNNFALATPVIARIGQTGHSEQRADEPLSTVTTKAEHLLVSPVIVSNMTNNVPRPADEPVSTILTGNHKYAAAAFLARHYGDRGQRPGVPMDEPVSTVTACDHHSLVAVHISKERTGSVGSPADEPLHTVTSGGVQARPGTGNAMGLVASNLVKLRGTSNSAPTDAPLATISAGGWHHAEVRALLLAYYGTDQTGQLGEPLHTVTTRDRFGLVTVAGQDYVIADIGMRMLQPRELFRAQGFADSYVIDHGFDPTTGARVALTKSDQVRMCGNSVCPKLAEAIVRENFSDELFWRQAA